ncbi:NF038129 family PEP-CTERM protein [Duganella sp. LjRoot269]|jgi:hypothetical protein|uniref:NF038129 family PEP-CTERM protein n=1 Tax=Duganella sp. LjRoot269 TaxID=3342305 RepID=UPI003ED13A00
MFASHLSFVRRALLALVIAAGTSLASAQTMHVELDTSQFSDTGWIDLQFNPSNMPVASAGAVISNLSGFGSSADAVLSGDVQQQAGGFLFGNSTSWNDLFHSVAFGGKVSFDVSFSGLSDAAPAAIPTKFSVALYGADGATQLGDVDQFGNLLSLTWQPTAGAGIVALDIHDHTIGSVSAVPEPTTWAMLGAGLALVGLARRRKLQA